eukprot:SAG22_NODE_53_length_24242_cov_158.884231_12_plen_121_part_00
MCRPFGTVHPTINVTAPVWGANASGIRARAWANETCVYIVVVNANQESSTEFALTVLSGPARDFAPPGEAATRLFDAKYNVSISATGHMHDHVEAGATNIYAAGPGSSCPYSMLKMAPGR